MLLRHVIFTHESLAFTNGLKLNGLHTGACTGGAFRRRHPFHIPPPQSRGPANW